MIILYARKNTDKWDTSIFFKDFNFKPFISPIPLDRKDKTSR